MSTKKYAKIEENGRVRFAMFSSDEAAKEQGFLPYEEKKMPTTPIGTIPHNYSRKYEEKDGKIIMSWEAYPNYEEIDRLKKKLTETDYQVIKCYEASLVGGDMPYDVQTMHKERQEIRNEINRLEACE